MCRLSYEAAGQVWQYYRNSYEKLDFCRTTEVSYANYGRIHIACLKNHLSQSCIQFFPQKRATKFLHSVTELRKWFFFGLSIPIISCGFTHFTDHENCLFVQPCIRNANSYLCNRLLNAFLGARCVDTLCPRMAHNAVVFSEIIFCVTEVRKVHISQRLCRK